ISAGVDGRVLIAESDVRVADEDGAGAERVGQMDADRTAADRGAHEHADRLVRETARRQWSGAGSRWKGSGSPVRGWGDAGVSGRRSAGSRSGSGARGRSRKTWRGPLLRGSPRSNPVGLRGGGERECRDGEDKEM